MKLDKRACRHAANAPLNISLNAGVLYTDRVKYLVTAAVKLLGGHRVLAVYFYECERLKANDRMPKWVVFQGKDDFATLERDAEGNVKWRDAMLTNLTRYYSGSFLPACVFYKKTGCHTIARYIHVEANPTLVLRHLDDYQQDIRDRQAKIRRYKRDAVVRDKMRRVPQTLANLKRWADKHIMPHYLFYDYNNGRAKTQARCTYCEKFSVIKRPKNNDVLRCPKCRQKVIAKAQGKRAAYHEDRETCQVIRRISPQELVVRIYKLYWSYAKGKDTIRKSAYEVMRIFVRSDNGKDATMEPYYYDSGYDSVTHWRYGYHPGALFGMACFSSEETGAVYLPGLEKTLHGTPWEYCALRQFYEQTGIPMQVSYYLKMYLRHPLLIERLTKAGFENIAADVIYRDGFSDALDEMQTKTHRILRVEKQDVSVLQEQKAGVPLLKKYQAYVAIHLRGRGVLFQWQLHHKVSEIPADIFQYLTAEKFMHYMEAQFPIYCEKRPANVYRDPTMETLVITYVDYLHMCRRQAYDMKEKSVLFPKNCAAAHDREAERIQKINDAQKNKAFGIAYAGFARKAALSNEELQIVCPKRANDLVAEGRALHHCVGSYIDRVAEGRCLIVFVRRVEEPKKPYVTVEVRDGKIAQIHGDHNSDPTEEVKKFVDLWSRKVLPMALRAV
jgi:DNA-directed RNA polymerase subunit RPC12/RpoP